jgi:hypothetical protein
MKLHSLIMITLIVCMFMMAAPRVAGQNSFPNLDSASLVSPNVDLAQLNKPYTIVIYGGVGCGYSKYLIEHLNVLDECKPKADIILIMDQPKDSLVKYMEHTTLVYPCFSNATLGYRLKKKPDIFPQVLVFKHEQQIEHIIGIKEGMLTKINARILKNE